MKRFVIPSPRTICITVLLSWFFFHRRRSDKAEEHNREELRSAQVEIGTTSWIPCSRETMPPESKCKMMCCCCCFRRHWEQCECDESEQREKEWNADVLLYNLIISGPSQVLVISVLFILTVIVMHFMFRMFKWYCERYTTMEREREEKECVSVDWSIETHFTVACNCVHQFSFFRPSFLVHFISPPSRPMLIYWEESEYPRCMNSVSNSRGTLFAAATGSSL